MVVGLEAAEGATGLLAGLEARLMQLGISTEPFDRHPAFLIPQLTQGSELTPVG